jgi:uncharacterized membrane protein YhaH (DUF805 family)
MADAVMGARPKAVSSRQFYVWMAGTCFAIAVLGFLPTYWVPLAKGSFKAEPMVHIHGILMFGWVTFFLTQALLIARGKTLAHRTWGMLGISIVTGIAFIVPTIISLRLAQAALPGQPPAAVHDARAFTWVTISALLFFVPVFTLAIVKLKDSETHKRLILLMTISMLGAPIARWFSLAAPPAPPWPAGLPDISTPPMIIAMVAGLLGDILLVVAIAYDWRTRGKVHPVYLIGGGIMLVMHLTTGLVGNSAAWQSAAIAIGKLGLPG